MRPNPQGGEPEPTYQQRRRRRRIRIWGSCRRQLRQSHRQSILRLQYWPTRDSWDHIESDTWARSIRSRRHRAIRLPRNGLGRPQRYRRRVVLDTRWGGSGEGCTYHREENMCAKIEGEISRTDDGSNAQTVTSAASTTKVETSLTFTHCRYHQGWSSEQHHILFSSGEIVLAMLTDSGFGKQQGIAWNPHGRSLFPARVLYWQSSVMVKIMLRPQCISCFSRDWLVGKRLTVPRNSVSSLITRSGLSDVSLWSIDSSSSNLCLQDWLV